MANSYYEQGRQYTQAELQQLIADLMQREDLAQRDFSGLQTTYGFDPGGTGTWGDPAQFKDASGASYYAQYAGQPSATADGALTLQQQALAAQAAGIPVSEYRAKMSDWGRDGSFKIEGHDGDYGLRATYNPDGSIKSIDPFAKESDSYWMAIRPVLAMAAMAAGGGALAGAQGAGAGAAGAGAAGAGATGGMTAAEALAAGVAPGAVGGGSMTGVVGGTAAGGAAAGGGLLSQLGQGASTVGGFLRDNASWLAPAAGAVAGALGTDTQELTPAQQQGIGLMQGAAENAPQTQAQMQGLLGQATAPQTAATNPLFGLDNPALTGAIDRAQQDLSRNYNTLVAPKFSMGSSFGSSGLGELETLARKDYTDSMANIGTQMRYQNFGLQAQLGESQAGRQDAMGNANANRAMSGVSAAGNIGMYPAQLGSMLAQNGGQPPAGNRWAGALGGGLLGAQLGGWMTQPQQQPQGGWMPASTPQQQSYFGGIQPKAWNGVAS